MQLALDDLQAGEKKADIPPEPAVAAEDSTQPTPDRNVVPLRRASRELPAHLPRETVIHAPATCSCPACGSAMRTLGEDVSEMLDFVPGYFKVIRHVRPKLSCGRCSTIVQQPAPSRPIERCLPAPGLLALVIVAKYADHSPLYRQQGIYRRVGVDLDRATLAGWVADAARLLDPLASAIGRYVLKAEKVHGDDTSVPVLDPGRGRTKTGRLWTYVRDDRPAGSRAPPAMWYRYSPDRQGMRPREHWTARRRDQHPFVRSPVRTLIRSRRPRCDAYQMTITERGHRTIKSHDHTQAFAVDTIKGFCNLRPRAPAHPHFLSSSGVPTTPLHES